MRSIAVILIFAYALVCFHQAGHGEIAGGLDQRTHFHAGHSSLFEFDHTHAGAHHHHDDHDHGHHDGHDHSGEDHCEGSHDHHHYSHDHLALVSLAPSGKQTAKSVHAPVAMPVTALPSEWNFQRSFHRVASVKSR